MKRIVLAVGFLSARLTLKAKAEIGQASHYGHGDGFQGRRTASGERFNKMAMTAAHRTRRMGSHVSVTWPMEEASWCGLVIGGLRGGRARSSISAMAHHAQSAWAERQLYRSNKHSFCHRAYRHFTLLESSGKPF